MRKTLVLFVGTPLEDEDEAREALKTMIEWMQRERDVQGANGLFTVQGVVFDADALDE